MAKLSAEVRFCLASDRTPAEAVNRINAAFCRAGWDDRFVTFVLAVLDRSKHEVSIVNAGHMAPLLRHASGQVEEIGEDEAGFPLGIDADMVYRQSCRPLAPGESLTMFTDGISEAMNDAGELYGIQRLREQLAGEERPGVGRGPSGARRRAAVRRRPAAERRHVPGFVRPAVRRRTNSRRPHDLLARASTMGLWREQRPRRGCRSLRFFWRWP